MFSKEKFILNTTLACIFLDVLFYVLKINLYIGVSSIISAVLITVFGKKMKIENKNIIYVRLTILLALFIFK